MNKKWRILILSILMSTLLSGCGSSDEKLDTYKANLDAFTEIIAQRSEAINNIDSSSENAVKDLLENLDAIERVFTSLAELEVPSQFSNAEELADDADNYMKEAVSLYHEAFESETYDEFAAEAALENYNRAMKRIQYIADILKGEIPEGDDVVVTTVDEETN